MRPADNALDLGTGGGRLAGALEECRRVAAIDRSQELLHRAELEYPNIKFFPGDILDSGAWDLAGPPFDLVVSNCAVRRDHTPDLELLAELCRAKTSPGSRIVLRLQARDDLREILPGTVRELFFSRKELERAFPGARIQEEAYRQRFSPGHFRRFLERIDIKWNSDFQGTATRRNLILVRD